MYNGELDGKKGVFIGVKYDEPFGKNDGSYVENNILSKTKNALIFIVHYRIDGKRYFECQPKYGGFVIPSAVEVGDFKVEDEDLDEEI